MADVYWGRPDGSGEVHIGEEDEAGLTLCQFSLGGGWETLEHFSAPLCELCARSAASQGRIPRPRPVVKTRSQFEITHQMLDETVGANSWDCENPIIFQSAMAQGLNMIGHLLVDILVELRQR